jgi:CDP-diacylglycerol--serine O-phosphatidyltransferase
MDNHSTEHKEVKRGRGIYLLPNLFTTAALFAGFYAIVAAMNGRFEAAAVAIFIAMFMDGMDGRIARLTHTQSEFGVQYDSLSDMIAFGLAPALVMYVWALGSLGKLGWLAAFVYTAGAALRLARFNTQVAIVDKGHFQGLPSPPSAALLAGFIWVCHDYGINGEDYSALAFLLTVIAGVLMVSNMRFKSFKDFDLKGKVPFVAILIVVLIFVFISIDPPIVLFSMASTYALSGPIGTVFYLRKRRAERAASGSSDIPPPDEQA